MKPALSGLASMLLGLASTSCADHQSPPLRTSTASVCRAGQSLLVSEHADGRIRLNFAVLDSNALTRTLPVILGPRAEKTVMVHVDATRGADLRWIVQAIERAGGFPYALDSACLQRRAALASIGSASESATRAREDREH